MLADLAAGAADNATNIVRLRKAYNDYVLGGGTLSFEEFAKQFGGISADPYKKPTA